MDDSLREAREVLDELDRQMADLFVRRMETVRRVAACKQAHGWPVSDPEREAEMIRRHAAEIADGQQRAFYVDFLKHLLSLSRAYQTELIRSPRFGTISPSPETSGSSPAHQVHTDPPERSV